MWRGASRLRRRVCRRRPAIGCGAVRPAVDIEIMKKIRKNSGDEALSIYRKSTIWFEVIALKK